MNNTTQTIVTVPAPVEAKAVFNNLALQQLALSKASVCDNARDQVTVGKHNVDFTVRVQGSVNVGEDYQQTPTANIPILAAFAIFTKYAGITREAATNLLIKSMNEAMASEQDMDEVVKARIEEIESIKKELQEKFAAKLDKKTCKGKVTTKLTATIV